MGSAVVVVVIDVVSLLFLISTIGAPAWVGWAAAVLCMSLLAAACIIYVRQVMTIFHPRISNCSWLIKQMEHIFFHWENIVEKSIVQGAAQGMEVYRS